MNAPFKNNPMDWQKLLIGETFIGQDSVALILGDNIFGSGLNEILQATTNPMGALFFAYHVQDTALYGVVEFDSNNKVISIEEKPEKLSRIMPFRVFIFYDNSVVQIAKTWQTQQTWRTEITDVNKAI